MEKVLLSKMESQFSFFGTMSLLYGILFTACMYQNWNGATFPVLVVFTNLFGFQYVKQIGLKIQKDTWVYAAGMILLSISSFMTTNTFLIFFNWIGIFLLFVVMMIHQFYQDTDWSFQVYLRNILMIIGTTVGSIFYPIRHAAAYITPKTLSRKRTVLYIFSGVAIAACLLLVILPLLVHSDQIFALYFGRFTSHIRFGNIFWIFVMTFAVGILCYAFFSALCRETLKVESETTEKKYSPVVAITFTSVIAVIYLFYSAIQIIYLLFSSIFAKYSYDNWNDCRKYFLSDSSCSSVYYAKNIEQKTNCIVYFQRCGNCGMFVASDSSVTCPFRPDFCTVFWKIHKSYPIWKYFLDFCDDIRSRYSLLCIF